MRSKGGKHNAVIKALTACLCLCAFAVQSTLEARDDDRAESPASTTTSSPSSGPTDEPAPETNEDALDFIQEPFPPFETEEEEPELDPGGLEEAIFDPCDWTSDHPEFQEDTQDFFRGVSCHSFRWFDGLFGDEIEYPADEVNGLVTLGGSWTQYEQFDSRARFKVRAPLPNADNRWNLLIGRGDDDAFISDTQSQDQTFYNPGLINRGEEDSLLLGLGHRGKRGARKGWDWSLGVRFRTPPVPYVRARYYYFKDFTQDTDLRLRQTFFWRSDDGFGSTTRGDLATALNPENVMRWEALVKVSEVTEGAEWFAGQTWYHLFKDRRAFSLLLFAEGETDAEVPLKEYGLNFIWRQPFTRDWIYISYGPSVTWPRFFKTDTREMSLGFGVWLEMEFGNWEF